MTTFITCGLCVEIVRIDYNNLSSYRKQIQFFDKKRNKERSVERLFYKCPNCQFSALLPDFI